MFGFGSKERLEDAKMSPKSPEETDIRLRPDRVGQYLEKHLKKFEFDAFSEKYIRDAGLDFMRDVPIPLRREDREAFASDKGLTPMHLGENMACVMGVSPKFPHTEAYVRYLTHFFRKKAAAGLVNEAKNFAEKEEFDDACIHFRGALCVDPENLAAMYGYARVCRAMYMKHDKREYVGNLKAEALEFFELTTQRHPRFSMAYYYLGYAYLNIGLYRKAQLAWKGYMRYSTHPKDGKEIKERLTQLVDPIKIEDGYNAVLAGRYGEGVASLEPYLKSRYNDWWPLYYYLGAAYAGAGREDEAKAMFKQTLKLNPSHAETMDELARLCEAEGDAEGTEKYRRKAELVRGGGHR